MISTSLFFGILTAFATTDLEFKRGDIVVVIQETNLKIGNQTGDKVHPGLALKVKAVNGKWLWVNRKLVNGLTWEINPGWLESQHVVAANEAIPYLTVRLRNSPTNAQLFNARGWARLNVGIDTQGAIGDFDEAIRLDPAASSYHGRGESRGQDYDEAISDYNEAIKRDPKQAAFYKSRGLAWRYRRDSEKPATDFDAAIADYSEAIRLDSKDRECYRCRADLWEFKRQYDKAIADYDAAIQLDPKDVDFYSYRASAYFQAEQYAKAISDYETILRLGPKEREGDCCSDDWSLSKLNYGDSGLGHLYATCPDEKYRNGKKAIEHATKACEQTEWKDAHCMDTLAAAYAEAGDFEKAVEWETKAMALAGGKTAVLIYKPRLDLYKAGKPYRHQLRGNRNRANPG